MCTNVCSFSCNTQKGEKEERAKGKEKKEKNYVMCLYDIVSELYETEWQGELRRKKLMKEKL